MLLVLLKYFANFVLPMALTHQVCPYHFQNFSPHYCIIVQPFGCNILHLSCYLHC